MNYTQEQIDRGDYLHDERRDAKMDAKMEREGKMEMALREVLANQPTFNQTEVILYALTCLEGDMDDEIADIMALYLTPDAIVDDEIESAFASIVTLHMRPRHPVIDEIMSEITNNQPTTTP